MPDSNFDQSRLPQNILAFSRLLRAAGLPVGSGKVLDAQRAVACVGLQSRADIQTSLFAVFVTRADQREIFDQAFHLFWKNPGFRERLLGAMLPTVKTPTDNDADILRRVGEALSSGMQVPDPTSGEQELEFDASLSFSNREVLQEKDFEQMSAKEIAEATKYIAQLRLPKLTLPTRRYRAANNGDRLDMQQTIRAAMRNRDLIPLRFKQQRERAPALVVLCDISGSMSQYSRMFLHFMHAVTNDRDRVHSFVFGTRLTNISRYLRHREIDRALEAAGGAVQDWSGGTRIGSCLKDFNKLWSRRVLGQGAITLIISDGLDRDAGAGLRQEMERLNKSSRQLIWLNPLLRYEGFEPRALGIKTMLPYVDRLIAGHNIASLQQLIEILSGETSRQAA